MECPKCSSNQVERLPPSQISPKPGYRCNNCGLKMRSSGMLVVYVFILFIGLAFFLVALYATLDDGDRILDALAYGQIGLVVAGYSLLQIARPVPRRTPETEETE